MGGDREHENYNREVVDMLASDARVAGVRGQSSDILTFPPRPARGSLSTCRSFLIETFLARGATGERCVGIDEPATQPKR